MRGDKIHNKYIYIYIYITTLSHQILSDWLLWVGKKVI